MISILLLIGLVAPGPRIIEQPEAGADRIVVQVVVRPPFDLGEREQEAWRALGELLSIGSQDFTPEQIAQMGSTSGVLPQLSRGEGHLRLQVVTNKAGLDSAGQFIDSLFRNPYLRDRDVDVLMKRAAASRGDGWAVTLDPWQVSSKRIAPSLVRDLASQAFQPANMTIVVSGAIEPGTATAVFANRFMSWPQPTRRGPSRFDLAPMVLGRRTDTFASIELRGAPIAGKDVDLARAALAIAALGTGKEATVFRVLRQELGLSYLQSAVLWPTAKGWTPRLLLQQKSRPESNTLLVRSLEAVGKDVDGWDDSVLARAKAMVRASAIHGLPDGPFSLGGFDSAGVTPEEKSGLSSLMAAYGFSPGFGDSLPSLVQSVTLEELKQEAKKILSAPTQLLLLPRQS